MCSVLSRFLNADTLIPQPGDAQAWDRFAYALNNPVTYIDPNGHWSISISTSQISYSINYLGNLVGISNSSNRLANYYSNTATFLDCTALSIDTAITLVDAASAYVGFTAGAAIAVPGGEAPVVVTGPLGASVGIAVSEIALKPLLNVANALATTSAALTIGSDALTGETMSQISLTGNENGILADCDSRVSSDFQYAAGLTIAGNIAPLAPISLPIQAAAVANDIGKMPKLPTLSARMKFFFSLKKPLIDPKIKVKWE